MKTSVVKIIVIFIVVFSLYIAAAIKVGNSAVESVCHKAHCYYYHHYNNIIPFVFLSFTIFCVFYIGPSSDAASLRTL